MYDFIILRCSDRSLLSNDLSKTYTIDINVPPGTAAGTVSKALVSVAASDGNYFLYTTFVITVIDGIVRVSN